MECTLNLQSITKKNSSIAFKGQVQLCKERYKNIWVNTQENAQKFKYVELVERLSESALTSEGYVLMDKIRCFNSPEEKGLEFLGYVTLSNDGITRSFM
jgi:hypothetical protein